MKQVLFLLLACLVTSNSICHADTVEVTGGRSDADLDLDQLLLVGLTYLGSTDAVDPSPRGPGWVGFNINGRDHATRPTTFVYTVFDLLPVTGTVEHSGSVTFDADPAGIWGMSEVVMGDFSIGYDAARATALNSGFFVESKLGTMGILFDIGGGPGGTFPADERLIVVESNLLVSIELARDVLGDATLAGLPVGNFSVNGVTAIPEPSSLVLLGLLGMGVFHRRRVC